MCVYLHVLGHDAMVDGLQDFVRQLNKLCKNIQIVREYSAREDNIIEKVAICVTCIVKTIYVCIINYIYD